MICKLNVFIFIFLLGSTPVYSHGEDKPGPHGGRIVMPGAFHVEVVKSKNEKFYVMYLLDISFKNPSVKNSSVKILKSAKDKESLGNCVVKKDAFECRLKVQTESELNQAVVESSREGVSGALFYLSSLKLL